MPDDPASALMRLLAGKWVVQALATAAELGVAEALDEPKEVEELAKALRCHPPSLLRLLRVLVGEGVLVEHPDGRFELTAMGQHLRGDALGTLARFVGSPSQWAPWTALTHAVRTGQSAFEHAHGESFFDYLARRPDEARLYDDAVDAFTTAQARALAGSSLLDDVEIIVDVGGGRGTLLAELLARRPALRGILFDRPHVIEAARQRFEAAKATQRCEFVSGDFFEAIPTGADAYVLKHVLHNWPDDQARGLLERCAAAMKPGGRVFIVEALLLPGNLRDVARLIDLEMLVLTGGGRERSKPELRRLIATAGLRLTSTVPLSQDAWLLVAEPPTDKTA